MGVDILVIIAILFVGIVIGVVIGGMAVFTYRRFTFNRQMRIAERRASKVVSDARDEA